MIDGAKEMQSAAVVQGLGHELPKLVARVRFPAAAPQFIFIFTIDRIQLMIDR